MTELKFRAWLKKYNIMQYSHDNKKNDIDDNFLERFFCIVHPENHIIMQFTGLKDRLNKEIYEVDILERDDDKEHLLTVICKDGMFGFYDIDPISKELYSNSDLFSVIAGWLKYSKLIVVGNIYENPDVMR